MKDFGSFRDYVGKKRWWVFAVFTAIGLLFISYWLWADNDWVTTMQFSGVLALMWAVFFIGSYISYRRDKKRHDERQEAINDR